MSVLDPRWEIRIFRIWAEAKFICSWLYLKRVLGCRPRMYLQCIWPEAKYICIWLYLYLYLYLRRPQHHISYFPSKMSVAVRIGMWTGMFVCVVLVLAALSVARGEGAAGDW